MICNKCGAENPDAFKHCAGCGHKLQSGGEERRSGAGRALRPRRLELLETHIPVASPEVLGKYVEAWLVAVLVCAATWVLVDRQLAWPFYPLAALAAGYCRLRGITWGL